MRKRLPRLLALFAGVAMASCVASTNHPAETPANRPATQPSPTNISKPPESPPKQMKRAAPAKSQTLDEMLLFFPTPYPKGNWKPEGLVFEDVWFNAEDGTKLHGWYCPCKNARTAVLYLHGNAGNLSHRAHLMRYFQEKLRISAFIFDYRGYGRSEGVPTVEGVLQDGRAARAVVAEREKIKETQVVLMGRSLGGAVAVDLAAREGARGLVLESTFSSLKEVASHHYPRLAWLVSATKLNSVSLIAQYRGPLLQSHGDADRTIPYALGRKLYEAANMPKQFVAISGGDHNDPPPATYREQLARFMGGLPD